MRILDKEGYFLRNIEAEGIEFIPEVEFACCIRHFASKKSHKRAIRVLRNLAFSTLRLINNYSNGDDEDDLIRNYILSNLNCYLTMIPRNRKKREHLQLFLLYGMPKYLVDLYKSPIKYYKGIGEESIRLFIYPNIQSYPIYIQHLFASIALRFTVLLYDDKATTTTTTTTTSASGLYYSCRQTYIYLLKSIGPANTSNFFMYGRPRDLLFYFHPFIRELTQQFVVNMKLVRESCFCRVPSSFKSRFESDIRDFSVLTLHMCTKIEEYMRSRGLSSFDLLPMEVLVDVCYNVTQLLPFWEDLNKLIDNIDLGLTYMDDGIEYTRCTECEFNHGWSYYLSILKELNFVSTYYNVFGEKLSSCLNSHRASINKLVMNSNRGDDHQWLLRHKNLLNNESRRHLITMIFPNQVSDHHPQKTKVLIDKSQLLVDSFKHVGLANPILLRNGIIPQFKNEVAIAGHGVFKGWLLLLCQHLFTPQNTLFLSCPHNPQRLYLNPAKVDRQILQYYGFCGRVIALALMHDVQIGIGFDRLFLLQLAGSIVTLEDIRDVDPYMYKSCRDILEMDYEYVDSDGLGLTFVWETEEEDEAVSRRKIVELCSGGNEMVLNSTNREEYIKLVIQHCFMKSVEEKVKLIIQGLDDVLTRRRRKTLFESIELEDLDHMLLEKNREDINSGEYGGVDDNRPSPFSKIIGTTLPKSRPMSIRSPLTCKQQCGKFHNFY